MRRSIVQYGPDRATKQLIKEAQSMAFVEGAASIIQIVQTYYEPLMHKYADLEALLGYAAGLLVDYPNGNFPRATISDTALHIGETLNVVEAMDHMMCAALGMPSPYLDLTPAQTWRSAMLGYVGTGNPNQLLALLAERPIPKAHQSIVEALKQRQLRGPDPHVKALVKAMIDIKAADKSIQIKQAAKLAIQQVGVDYPPSTAVTYYYRYRNELMA